MTTTRTKILYNPEEMPIFGRSSDVLWKAAQPWLEFVPYDPAVTYHRSEVTLMVPANCVNLWWRPFVDQGFGLIIENAAEVPDFINLRWIPVTDPRVLAHRPVPDSAMVLQSPNFFWFVTAWNQISVGYHRYVPNRQRQYLALIPVRREKPHRTQLIVAMGDLLDQCIWSRMDLGRSLPGDMPPGPNVHYSVTCNSDWYDQTCFSIVAESMTENNQPFITEKTFKAIAFQHPFMIVGDRGSLHHLRRLGFETWDNIWDESYDYQVSVADRIQTVVNNAVNYKRESLDTLTLEKIRHNHAWFFDQSRLLEIFRQDLIDPILEYANTAR